MKDAQKIYYLKAIADKNIISTASWKSSMPDSYTRLLKNLAIIVSNTVYLLFRTNECL